MSKKNPHNNMAVGDIATIIVKEIQSEPYFEPEAMAIKIRALIKSFKLNLDGTNYNKIKDPNETQRLLRALNQKDFENAWWRERIKEIASDEMQEMYNELDIALVKYGFKEPRK